MNKINEYMNKLYAVSIAEDKPINKKKTVVRFYLEDLANYVYNKEKKIRRISKSENVLCSSVEDLNSMKPVVKKSERYKKI